MTPTVIYHIILLKMAIISTKFRRYLLIVSLTILALIIALGVSRYRRLHAYDKLIVKIAAEQKVDPKLIRAVIWRESRFKYDCRGKCGEIGLMQVTKNAVQEWAQANGISIVRKTDLFNPETNINAGTWYLKRSINYWSNKPNPLPYALAEYNAGRSNAVRWAASDGNDANRFWDSITYPSTKRYVHDVLSHYRQ